jgi:hypothetical protein
VLGDDLVDDRFELRVLALVDDVGEVLRATGMLVGITTTSRP